MNVPVSLATILTIRENSAGYQRSLFFENISSDTLSIQIQESTDGGATWVLIGTAFSLAAAAKIVKEISSANSNILRIQASGGGDDRDLSIGYSRLFANTATWTDPTL
jgi:hypothetical protein